MQLFIDNWSATLLAPATASAVSLSVEPAKAALLTGLGSGDFYRLTLVEVDASGTEIDWDVVQVTAAAAGVLTVTRTDTARSWTAGSLIEARLTAAGMEELRDAAGGVAPGDLAEVAFSGDYADLTGTPAIPSTAADVGAIPTSQKGAASGVATLDADGKVPLAQVPATAITNTSVVNTQAAMLALVAQVGDVAIRPDISSSFILQAEPASSLANWQQILTPAAGGGAAVGSATPQALGSATPGVSGNASREDHVHPLPTPASIGAATSAQGALAESAVQPEELTAALADKVDKVAGKGLSTNDYTTPEKTKLAGVAAGATANADTDSLAEGGTNKYFTESRVRSAVLTGLNLLTGGDITAADSVLTALGKLQKRITDAVAAISGKQDTLVSGTNLKTVNGSSLLGSGNIVIAGGVQRIPVACSDETTALTAGAAKITFRMQAFTLSGVAASLTTAQASGSILTIDINVGGVSILSTKLTIDNTEKTSTTAAVPAVISSGNIPEDAEITIDIDQIGDGTAKGLKVYFIGVPA